jgi:hypothetical protein
LNFRFLNFFCFSLTKSIITGRRQPRPAPSLLHPCPLSGVHLFRSTRPLVDENRFAIRGRKPLPHTPLPLTLPTEARAPQDAWSHMSVMEKVWGWVGHSWPDVCAAVHHAKGRLRFHISSSLPPLARSLLEARVPATVTARRGIRFTARFRSCSAPFPGSIPRRAAAAAEVR